MSLKETVERFAHLDIVLGDWAWCADSLLLSTAHDLWQAVKAGQAEIEAKNAQLAKSEEHVHSLRAQLGRALADAERLALKAKAWDEEEAYRGKIGEYLNLLAQGLRRVAPSRRAYEAAAAEAREATRPGSAKELADL